MADRLNSIQKDPASRGLDAGSKNQNQNGKSSTLTMQMLGTSPGGEVKTLFDRIDGNPFPVLAVGFILHGTVNFGKQRVIPAATYIGPRMDNCAQLTHQYVACLDDLAAEALNAAPLSPTVPAVS